ncbi:MAG TPA: endopeptidase La [Blastocatellia bacterium]|jgi:ATP-dependent Lon protease|nr:endopeptidase La [Blastocatellia bacterium]
MNEQIESLPVLPIKNSVLFPGLLMPLTAGRPSSVAAIDAALASEDKELLIVTQRDSSVESPTVSDLYTIGTKAVVKRMMRRQDGAVNLIVQGVERVVLIKIEQAEPYLVARVRMAPVPEETNTEVEAMRRAILELSARAIQLAQPNAPVEVTQMLAENEEPLQLTYLIGSVLGLPVEKEQGLLEAPTRLDALRLLHSYLLHELQVLELRNQINVQAQGEMERQQREYLLRQQLRAIQEELGETSPEQADAEMFRKQMDEAQLPEDVRKEAERELSRMEKLPQASPDYHVIRTYLEMILELPWGKSTEDNLDLAHARQVLDEDHFDLKEVKERILEHLGVLKLNPTANAPILCFVGPPGVGKTSLGQSIARSLGRKFERLALGGMHDEAELRGHRRTYIGAMPGRIIQAMRRAESKNPVLMLDEVDKLGRDFRGDPAAALLEVLDPAQNHTFRDNYLDLPFNLSKVFFITTANTIDTIPSPLLDRMEMLRLSGYSAEEKMEIAHRYLIPRQLKESGLTDQQFILTDEALNHVIGRYTREAGVRQLERAIGSLTRRVALRFAEGDTTPAIVRVEDLPEMLGPERFTFELARKQLPPGVATGLAWTETGGDVLYIEATLLPAGRGMTLTGHLGEVMQESAKAAQSFIWAHAERMGIDPNVVRRSGVHVHVPAGAIPKDGPSAGITMATALASVYTDTPVRSDTAMTGEITLTGLVLPIGGIKEKALAARRAGITRVILPRENQKDLRELPDNVRAEMEFIFAERVEEVLIAAMPDLASRLTLPKAA